MYLISTYNRQRDWKWVLDVWISLWSWVETVGAAFGTAGVCVALQLHCQTACWWWSFCDTALSFVTTMLQSAPIAVTVHGAASHFWRAARLQVAVYLMQNHKSSLMHRETLLIWAPVFAKSNTRATAHVTVCCTVTDYIQVGPRHRVVLHISYSNHCESFWDGNHLI